MESHFYHYKSLGRLWTINQSVISKVFVNPFMHNVEKYSGILLKSCGVHKFDDLSTVYMKEWSFDALDDDTAKNTVISPNFPKISKSISRNWQITRNYAETVLFHKISKPENLMKLRYFPQCEFRKTSKLHAYGIEKDVVTPRYFVERYKNLKRDTYLMN